MAANYITRLEGDKKAMVIKNDIKIIISKVFKGVFITLPYFLSSFIVLSFLVIVSFPWVLLVFYNYFCFGWVFDE